MNFRKLIPWVYYSLFILVPLVFTSKTSEIFEINKIVIVYLGTIIILILWASQSIVERKILFRRTMLDIPLSIFLISQLASTIFSMDFRTSFLGYYSRFNGGLISTLCYTILYWGYVTFMDRKSTKKALLLLFAASLIASSWAILEHFGIGISCLLLGRDISVNCWVQDVQNRVYSTFGQPNWLAAFLVALIPLAWAKSILNSQFTIHKNKNYLIYSSISLILFIALLFTKSRSGILGFIASFIIFWGFNFKVFKPFILTTFCLLLATILIGTPWTASLLSAKNNTLTKKTQGTALETGGTESGKIRQIVWKGAIDVWKHYPIFGSGVETFALSYFQFRPPEHNLVSEWDYTYNKAHNEYLNYLATTGTIGLIAYLILIFFSLVQISNLQFKNSSEIQHYYLKIALLAGYASILITNFFGFSVVATSLLFFLFPAFAVSLHTSNSEYKVLSKNPSTRQKLLFIPLILTTYYLILSVGHYWYADTLYAKGLDLNSSQTFPDAQKILTKATDIEPSEANYWMELAKSTSAIAVGFADTGNTKLARESADKAIKEIANANVISPKNVSFKRTSADILTDLSILDSSYLLAARGELNNAIILAPTDPRLFYSLGLTNLKIGQNQEAAKSFRNAIGLKVDYTDARLALALALIKQKDKKGALEELNYILQKLDSENKIAKETLKVLQKLP